MADLTPVCEWFIAPLNNAKTLTDGRKEKENGVCRFNGAFKVLERLQPLTRGIRFITDIGGQPTRPTETVGL
jgi:hypothetical protein